MLGPHTHSQQAPYVIALYILHMLSLTSSLQRASGVDFVPSLIQICVLSVRLNNLLVSTWLLRRGVRIQTQICLASCFSHHSPVFLFDLLIVSDVFQSREEVEKLLQFAVFYQD